MSTSVPNTFLLGLIKAGSGTAASLLKHFGVDLDKVRIEVEKLVQSGRETNGRRPLTLRTKRVIEFSIMEARHLNHGYVGTEHILLGLLREHEGIAGQVLTQYFAIRLEEVREAILRLSEPREEAE